MTRQTEPIYEFGPFRMDAAERLLQHSGETISLPPKAFDLLLVLVENSGHLVEKEELMRQVWPEISVEEANLSRNVFILRKVLDKSEDGPQYIETVPKRGYRFVAGVRAVLDESADLMVKARVKSHVVLKPEEGTSAAEEHIENEEPAPEQAFTTSRRADRVLRWRRSLLALAAPVMLVGLAVAFFSFGNSRQRKLPEVGTLVKSIAVLPFESIGAEGSDEYLGLGMADDLITKLSNVKHLIVRPTSAVRKYAGQEQDPSAAGRALGVDAVLRGNIRRSGESIRVTVQLVKVADGQPLWGDKFDEKFTHIFVVQDSISERVAEALRLKLTREEQRLIGKHYTENTEAYLLYQQCRDYYRRRTRIDIEKSIECYKQAIKKDPKYALAYVGLAAVYRDPSSPLPPRESREKIKSLVLKAHEKDSNLAEAHTWLAILSQDDWDWDSVKRECERALELDPNSVMASGFYAIYLSRMERHDEAIAQMKQILEIDPNSVFQQLNLGIKLYYARRYDQAIKVFKKTIDMDENYAPAHARLGAAYVHRGDYEPAIAELERARALDNSPERVGRFAWLAYAYAVSGKKDKARQMLAELKKQVKQRYIPPFNFAIIYAGLGKKDQAFAWLEQVYEEGNGSVLGDLKVDPMLDSLRSDPRFADLLRRVNLAP